jgi:hypothetical protein
MTNEPPSSSAHSGVATKAKRLSLDELLARRAAGSVRATAEDLKEDRDRVKVTPWQWESRAREFSALKNTQRNE